MKNKIIITMVNNELYHDESDGFEVVLHDYDLEDYENIDPVLIQTDSNGDNFIELVI
jgi:hypothetical protein